MNCDDIRSHLSAYRDGEGSPQRRWRIRAHLRDCEGCRRELQRLESVYELLDSAPKPPPISDDFTRKVVARAQRRIDNDVEDHGTRKRRVLSSAWGVVAAAVVLVVGVGSGLIAGPPMWNYGAGPDKQPDPCAVIDDASSAPSGSLADVYRDVDDPAVY